MFAIICIFAMGFQCQLNPITPKQCLFTHGSAEICDSIDSIGKMSLGPREEGSNLSGIRLYFSLCFQDSTYCNMPFYELVCIARHNIVEVSWNFHLKQCTLLTKHPSCLEQLEGSFEDFSKASDQSWWCG